MQRRNFIKNAGIVSGIMVMSSHLSDIKSSGDNDFTVMDLHIHLTDTFTIDQIMEIAEKRKVKFGIVEHPAVWAIKDMAHTPHDKFILMAKEQGLKFTVGSDSRNSNAGRLDYYMAIAKKCRIKEEDFYKPGRLN